MAVVLAVPLDDPSVTMLRPHDPDGFWTIEVDGSHGSGFDVRWHASPFGGDIQMRESSLRALRDAINRELGSIDESAAVPTMDAETVPAFVIGGEG